MTAHAARITLALCLVASGWSWAGGPDDAIAAMHQGRPPAARGTRPIFFNGRFADPRWGGTVVLVVSNDGRTVMSVGGIAPGPCDDEDFGRLLPGKDGATGPVFYGFTPARIHDNGSFAISERQAGQRRPFKPARSLVVAGRFAGDTVRGTLRASTTTPFDACTANASFTARRVLG